MMRAVEDAAVATIVSNNFFQYLGVERVRYLRTIYILTNESQNPKINSLIFSNNDSSFRDVAGAISDL